MTRIYKEVGVWVPFIYLTNVTLYFEVFSYMEGGSRPKQFTLYVNLSCKISKKCK